MKLTPPPPGARRSSKSKRAVPAPQPFHAFIAYADLPAAKRALTVINEVLDATAGKFALKPMLWRFDQLCADRWSETAIADAHTASVVVLASSAPGPVAPAVESWVTKLLHRKQGGRITVVSLQGEDDAWTISIEAPSRPAVMQNNVRSMPVPLNARAA
jgi:hypothetical protein